MWRTSARKPGALMYAAILLIMASCESSKRGLFRDKRPPHEKYADRLKEVELDRTSMGVRWFAAALESMAAPTNIELPYKETGYFPADEPSAAGYVFRARRGELIRVSVTTVPVNTPALFTELWLPGAIPQESKLLQTADSLLMINHEVERDGNYLIRLQPELLQDIEYTLTITTAPSLAFPVAEEGRPRLISFWSDPRDGGSRSHEGVDIGAAFKTPALAAADGYISRVTENRLGGNVVFLRPEGKSYALYYAHLDTQSVSEGDRVKAGQVVGLVGNTGNARSTEPHLHFGIYAVGGAVDPLPFIRQERGEPKETRAALSNLNKWMRTKSGSRIFETPNPGGNKLGTLKAGEAVKVLSATDNWYRITTVAGSQGFLPGAAITGQPLRTYSPDSVTRLLAVPSAKAPSKRMIAAAEKIPVLGTYGDYYLVRYEDQHGWVEQ